MWISSTRRRSPRTLVAFASVVLVVTLPSLAESGTISGQIYSGGKPVRQGVRLIFRCGGRPDQPTETGPQGDYRVFALPGKCDVRVVDRSGRESAPYTVFAEQGDVLIDLEMSEPGGSFYLKRR